jgi:hypothetical protein
MRYESPYDDNTIGKPNFVNTFRNKRLHLVGELENIFIVDNALEIRNDAVRRR